MTDVKGSSLERLSTNKLSSVNCTAGNILHAQVATCGKTKQQLLYVHIHELRNLIEKTSCLAVWTPSTIQDMSIPRITQTKLTYADLFSIYERNFMFMFTLMFLLMHVRNRICIRVSFILSLSLPVQFQKGRGLTFIFATSSLEHLSVGQTRNPPTK